MNRNYELTEETKISHGEVLHRIRATKTFSGITKGDIGGWIASEKNLSGNAWVSDNAEVSGLAMVSGHAMVYGNAEVSDHATVSGHAEVYGNATVSGHAAVYGNAEVMGNSTVSGHAMVSDHARVSGEARVTRRPVLMSGFKYVIQVFDNVVSIGCQQHPLQRWVEFTDAEISRMDSGALEWWRGHKELIVLLGNQYYTNGENDE